MRGHQNHTINAEERAIKEQEIEYYQRIIQKFCAFTPFNINAHIRLGKLYAELGNTEAAIREYAIAVDQYIHNGAVVKAIAVNKMIAMLDPQQEESLNQSSHFYFQQAESTERVSSPETLEPFSEEDDELEFPEYEHYTDDDMFFFSEEKIPKAELARKLAGISLFSHLTDAERQKIAEFLSPVRRKKGDAIITEGEIGDCMYLIQCGEVAIYTSLMTPETQHNTVHPEEQIHLASLQEGDFFWGTGLNYQ